MRPALLPMILLALALAAPVGARAGEPSFKDTEKAFKGALAAEDVAERLRAFDLLRDCTDPRGVDLVIEGVKLVKKEQERIRRDQVAIEEDYEKEFSKKVKADLAFEASARSSRDLDRYNKKVREIRKKLDRLRLRLQNLENDFTRTRAQLDGAVRAMTRMLSNLESSTLPAALATVRTKWRDAADLDSRMRWLDAIADLDRPLVAEQIRETAQDLQLSVEMRAAALETLGARKDMRAFDLALEHLKPGAEWDMTVAAVEVLRRLHEKRSIEPLIEFLKRDDLKRLREDVHRGLKSLTGKKHGPYFDPWHRWWEDAKGYFQMPAEPMATGDDEEPKEGVTFYGIHTFSDRVLFVLDVSGSMDQVPKGKPDGRVRPSKIEVARKELIGAIEMLDDGAVFNVIFFNHQVVPWQNKMQESSSSTRRRAKAWIESQDPQGGTNIHDALEAGFELALRVTGEPVFDTLYFLTDGRPTAGKIQEPERILAEVRDWNRAARVTIHCVGVGDHDQDFMQKLASLGGGRYVKR